MVCLGNICRSPLAEGILQDKLKSTHVKVDSAGTASYHIGSSPDHRSIEVAANNRIDISKQKARAFKTTDFDEFDHIYAMDSQNVADILDKARNEEDEQKVQLILKSKDVPDPYYGDIKDFEYVYALLNDACEEIKSLIT